MTTANDSIEITAPTVDQAISEALRQLRAQEDDVAIEVLSTPRSGVLGIGARQAKVRVTRRAPEGASSGVMSPPPAPPPKPRTPPPPRQSAATPRPVSPPRSENVPPPRRAPIAPLPEQERPMARPMPIEEEAEVEALAEESRSEETRQNLDLKGQMAEASEALTKILELMDEHASIETVRDDDPEMLELNIKGDGSGLLIGRHGQTLDALEYLVNRIVARRIKEAVPISIDTESYRARRRGQLHRMALSKGEEAKREHQAVTLEPMPPRDRRVIHLALKDDPLVTTRSIGDGFMRSIQILPTDERPDGSGPRSGRERYRGRGGPERRDSRSPGEQGGFRHGQKRIV